MRLVLLGLVLSWGVLAHPPRRNGASWYSLTRQGISTPIGLTDAQFDALVDSFDKNFPEVQAVVFYGSRTHHHYGNRPHVASDLDVLFYVWEASVFAGFQHAHPLQEFSSLIPGGLVVSAQEIPHSRNLAHDELFDRVMTPNEERELYHLTNNLRDLVIERRCALQIARGGASVTRFNRQAIVLLRAQSQRPAVIETLLDMGYHNLMVTRDSIHNPKPNLR